MFFGAVVIITISFLIFRGLKPNQGSIPQELLNQNNSIEIEAKKHVVQKGENLWNISVKYYGDGFKWVDIATENKIKNASIIEVGQELTIPTIDNKLSVDENLDTPNQNTQTVKDNTYTVVKGDSLWSIAIKVYGDGYRWSDIAKENKLSHPNLIHPGNVLAIPSQRLR